MVRIVKRGGFYIFLLILALAIPTPAFASKKGGPSDFTLTCANTSKTCVSRAQSAEAKKEPIKSIKKAVRAQDFTIDQAQAAEKQPQILRAGLNADALFSMVNQYRSQIGLTPFEKNEKLAQVAQSRGPELHNEIYGGMGMHSGFFKKNLPYLATENMISQNTEEAALQWWLRSSVHRGAIAGDYKYAAAVCAGFDCAMIFTNLAPKISQIP